jgi:hypothetical protein
VRAAPLNAAAHTTTTDNEVAMAPEEKQEAAVEAEVEGMARVAQDD